jgi:hypothetical protein
MSVNGQVDAAESILASIPDALPSSTSRGDTALATQATAEIRQVLTKLSAKTPIFRSTGICRLRVTTDDVEQDLYVPIRSVPFETYSMLLGEAYVEPPRKKQLNVETMEYEMVLDVYDAKHRAAEHAANVRFVKRYALHALDLEIEDDQGHVVWARTGSPQHEETALSILTLQGLTQHHFTQIREDAERLSTNAAKVDEALRLKKRSPA